MSKTGAELLIESLISAGVKHLFSLSGNQILSLYDASIGRDINLIHTRHEAAAVHMADGWGRLTEQPGVALLTAGPGHCNAISALYGALMARVAGGAIKRTLPIRPNRQRRISGDRPSRHRRAGHKSSVAGRRCQPLGRGNRYRSLSSLRRTPRPQSI